jgi:hypothetical protein
MQFFSSSVCLVGLLCINFFCHFALVIPCLSFCSGSSLFVILLCFCSSFHLPLHICSISYYAHAPFLFLTIYSFSLQNNHLDTVCFVFFYTHGHNVSTSQLLEQMTTTVQQTETPTDRQLNCNHESILLTDSKLSS